MSAREDAVEGKCGLFFFKSGKVLDRPMFERNRMFGE